LADERDAYDLITRIYDAAIDPSLWDSALQRLSDMMSGALVSFHIQDATGRVRLFRGVRADPYLTNQFLNGRGYTEPSVAPMAALLAMKPGTFVLREAVQGDADFRRSAIYNDIIRPQGLWHWGFSVVAQETDAAAIFGILRRSRAGAFAKREVDLLGRLLPHFQRAAQLSLRLDVLDRQKKAVEDVLDHLPMGVVLFDKTGRILLLNRVAGAFIASADGISVRNGRLAAERQDETTQLDRLIAKAAAASCGRGLSAGGVLALLRPSLARPFEVLIAPLRVGDGSAGTRNAAAVAFVYDPERMVRPAPDLLARLYNLTPKQAALAAVLAEGQSLGEAADALGIAHNTARAHLRLIVEKTGISRQSDLIRLILSGPAGLDLT
jgi:DNA-binding CsgD family transcriptional regulator/PAS domain-containing protein